MPARSVFPVILLVLALCAMAMLNFATPAGAGLANDSVAYIAGARSIQQGKGYSDIWLDSELEAITHYPPLLSLTLAGMGVLKLDPLRAARILNILLFGANTALIGLLGWRATRSKVAGTWLALIFMLNTSLLRVHVYAMSEPLFLFLSLLSFLLIDLYINKHQKTMWVALAGLTCGLAVLTRYSALALLPAFVIAIFLLQKKSREFSWAALRGIAIFLAAALSPLIAWFVRNKLSAGNATNRSFHFHPITSENIQPGFYNFAQFLMPVETWQKTLIKSGWTPWLLAVLATVLLVWLSLQTWKTISKPHTPAPAFITFTTVLYIFGYLGAVLFSMSFFDASTKFQPRILAPLYVSLMLLSAAAGAWLIRNNNRVLRGLALGLALISLAVSGYSSRESLGELSQAGQGYASWKWHDSELMASLRALPPGIAIYTNTPPAVYLVTGRASRTLPTAIDPVDNLPRADYQRNLDQMRADLLSGKAVLALFDTSTLEDALGMQNSADFVNGLAILQKTQGDVLYGKR
jgi:4-amino-4-deoxy-L-arabinose transferase-like glycosyltransferase